MSTNIEGLKIDTERSDLMEDQAFFSKFKTPLKYIGVFLLIFQSAVHVMVIRFSRVSTGGMYFASTAVFLAEVLKLFLCLAVALFKIRNFKSLIILLRTLVFNRFSYTTKLCVPACLFVLQQNLHYFSLSNMNPNTFQVIYQIKILFTAYFSVVLFKKCVKQMQWVALVLLCFGVALNLQQSQFSLLNSRLHGNSPFLGLSSILLSSVTSGFACVYFEKMLKESKVSILLLNIQLSVIETIVSLVTMILIDGIKIHDQGMFYGYSKFVWLAILLQAVGSILVVIVIHFSDSVLKCFCVAFSIIFSSISSIYVFNLVFSFQFLLGTIVIFYATYLYISQEI